MPCSRKNGEETTRLVITSVAGGLITAVLVGECSLKPGDEITLGAQEVEEEDEGPDLDDPDVWYGKLGVRWTGPGRRARRREAA